MRGAERREIISQFRSQKVGAQPTTILTAEKEKKEEKREPSLRSTPTLYLAGHRVLFLFGRRHMK